ncbi:DUF4190 domain-containing protein [Streptomyces sp. NPDC004609]|uniref:DUF4190 domain-containing protein n=1 Tax=Streptomyces sp. NPDC004609 TaxID=3364704 RepID=UPI0036A82334
MPTMTSMPGADTGAVPPPPIAPGGPAQPYGYPGAPGTAHTVPGTGDPYGAYTPYPGYQSYPQSGWAPGATAQNNMGVASMVLGILSVALFCLYGVVGLVLGVLALIFGIIGRKRAGRGEATNPGQALAGIILGSIGMLIGLAFIVILLWALIASAADERDRVGEYDDPYANSLVIGDPGGPR